VLPGPRAIAATRGVAVAAASALPATAAAVGATHSVAAVAAATHLVVAAAGRTSAAVVAVTLAVVAEVIRAAEATRVVVGDITGKQRSSLREKRAADTHAAALRFCVQDLKAT